MGFDFHSRGYRFELHFPYAAFTPVHEALASAGVLEMTTPYPPYPQRLADLAEQETGDTATRRMSHDAACELLAYRSPEPGKIPASKFAGDGAFFDVEETLLIAETIGRAPFDWRLFTFMQFCEAAAKDGGFLIS